MASGCPPRRDELTAIGRGRDGQAPGSVSRGSAGMRSMSRRWGRDLTVLLSQFPLQQFPRRVPRQVVDQYDLLWQLEWCQMLAGVRDQRRLVRVLAWAQHHEGR